MMWGSDIFWVFSLLFPISCTLAPYTSPEVLDRDVCCFGGGETFMNISGFVFSLQFSGIWRSRCSYLLSLALPFQAEVVSALRNVSFTAPCLQSYTGTGCFADRMGVAWLVWSKSAVIFKSTTVLYSSWIFFFLLGCGHNSAQGS